MTHQIIFIFPRDPKVVENWPEEINPILDSQYKLTRSYQKACEQAIANAIDFKLEEDKEKMRFATYSSRISDSTTFDIWTPQLNKSYDVPTGIEIAFEFNCRLDEMQCSEECHGSRNLAADLKLVNKSWHVDIDYIFRLKEAFRRIQSHAALPQAVDEEIEKLLK